MLGYDYSFVVDDRGFSGGLDFLWKDNMQVNLNSYTQYHISLKVIHYNNGKEFLLIGFIEIL